MSTWQLIVQSEGVIKKANGHWLKDRAHLSTFKIFIFEKFTCFIVLVVFLVIVQSSEMISVWFCEKMTFFPNFFSYHIFAIYVGGASLGLPTACRLIAVSGAHLPSVDGLVVRQCISQPPAISAGRLANRRVKPASHHLVKLGERPQEELPWWSPPVRQSLQVGTQLPAAGLEHNTEQPESFED